MAWFTVRSLPDLAGAVNKISEGVRNIEKNFDNALGLDENFQSSSNNQGQLRSLRRPINVEEEEKLEAERTLASASKQIHDKSLPSKEENEALKTLKDPQVPDKMPARESLESDPGKVYSLVPAEEKEPIFENIQMAEAIDSKQPKEIAEGSSILMSTKDKSRGIEADADRNEAVEKTLPVEVSKDSNDMIKTDHSSSQVSTEAIESAANESSHDQIQPIAHPLQDSSKAVSESVSPEVEMNQLVNDGETEAKEQHVSLKENASDSKNMAFELEKVKKEMKMMEAALKGAARQSQAKADEIAKFMNENERLKVLVEELKKKTNESEMQSLREEYHQKVSTLERKVYALTRERDTLRREQNRKNEAAALLKEKDEIITQVMAEGVELSKKQGAQEAKIRKLRTQVRELEEEKKDLVTKLQVEENNVESIKRGRAATENLLQETIEKHQSELAVQKEYYSDALVAAKDAKALAEAHINVEARNELRSRLREAEERETMLVQALEELRLTLSRTEQQAVSREDMLRKDNEDLQKRYQATELRCEELVTQVPDSTRPLLRQIEAIQESSARQAGVWAAVERSLKSRLQEAEAKVAAAQERERSVNERLSQTLSRVNVLEAQISCLRAEHTELSRSLEKERQRAAENRSEYLAAKEDVDTQEGRANQLEEQIREVRQKHKLDFEKVVLQREILQQEVEKEKAARSELERTSSALSTAVSEQSPTAKKKSAFENGNLIRKFSSASNLEESYYLQASLDPSHSFSDRIYPEETSFGSYRMKGIIPGAFESSLRQKQRELQSYMSQLASMESVRDSLAEELVTMTEQCEKLRAEATKLRGVQAELDALRNRHSAALELMGERDEELEELRADIAELKEMYRDQVNMLVNKA